MKLMFIRRLLLATKPEANKSLQILMKLMFIEGCCLPQSWKQMNSSRVEPSPGLLPLLKTPMTITRLVATGVCRHLL